MSFKLPMPIINMAPNFKQIIRAIQNDAQAIERLAAGDKCQFLQHIRQATLANIDGISFVADDALIRGIVTGCKSPTFSGEVQAAAQSYSKKYKALRSSRLRFITETGVNLAPSDRDKLLEAIPTYVVHPLPSSFPPLKHIVAESTEIYNRWVEHISTGYQPDKRIKRATVMELDPTDLVHDVGPNENACFRTKSDVLVGFVMRNFCP